jgi:hypothetical protein
MRHGAGKSTLTSASRAFPKFTEALLTDRYSQTLPQSAQIGKGLPELRSPSGRTLRERTLENGLEGALLLFFLAGEAVTRPRNRFEPLLL